MKKQFFLFVLLLMGVCKVSAQVDINQQDQQEVDKRKSEVAPLLIDILPPDKVANLAPPQVSQIATLERLFASLTKAKLNSSIRRNLLFDMEKRGMTLLYRHVIPLAVPGLEDRICVVKVPANAELKPSVLFLAHAEVRAIKVDAKERLRIHKDNKGESIELNKDVVISRIDTSASKPTDPYKGMPITIFSSDGDTAIGMDALCGSAVLLGLLENIISSDMQHGDIYFCVFKKKTNMNGYNI